jgi:hypothetical protein
MIEEMIGCLVYGFVREPRWVKYCEAINYETSSLVRHYSSVRVGFAFAKALR